MYNPAFNIEQEENGLQQTVVRCNNEISQPGRIIYSWHQLNVFIPDNGSVAHKCFWNCFKKNNSKTCSKKHILKNVSGVAYPGELLAIMGTSGVGKTSLLNALTFTTIGNCIVTGQRCANGKLINSDDLTKQSAYVQQDDLFLGNITVKEHLIFQALVRMNEKLTYKERLDKVEEVILELYLSKCQNTKIGNRATTAGISGGERKRLSLASELLTDPSLIVCDEPTAGLDSYIAFRVINTLKNTARKGKTVICTIHQPSSHMFQMFDKVMYLTDGRTAFLGTTEEAEVFFAQVAAPCPRNFNPADYYLEVISNDQGIEDTEQVDTICESYKQSNLAHRIDLLKTDQNIQNNFVNNNKNPYKVSWCTQFRAVFWRCWLNVSREPTVVKIRSVHNLVLSLLIGLIYYRQNLDQFGVMNMSGILFLFLMNMTFQNSSLAANEFCSTVPLFIREHHKGMYRTDVYYLAKFLAVIPEFMMLAILYNMPSYYLVGLNPEGSRFLTASCIMILNVCCAVSLGYMVASLSPNISVALCVSGGLTVTPLALLGGHFFSFSSMSNFLKGISYLSNFRYGYEAVMINQWSGVDYIENFNNSAPVNGQMVLETYQFYKENFTLDIAGMVLLMCLYNFIGYLGLLRKTCK